MSFSPTHLVGFGAHASGGNAPTTVESLVVAGGGYTIHTFTATGAFTVS